MQVQACSEASHELPARGSKPSHSQTNNTYTQPSRRPTQHLHSPLAGQHLHRISHKGEHNKPPDIQYSTIVTGAEVHAEASPPQSSCSREQQRLQTQPQQKPKVQDTHATENTLPNSTRSERGHVLEELRRLERENNLWEQSELELIA